MSRATQAVIWTSEDEKAEIEATIYGEFEESDYGVPGSPVWDELVNCGVEWPVSVNSEDVTREQMVARVGEEETLALEEALCGLANDDAWDMEEPDYE